jgi:hypothetical protein
MPVRGPCTLRPLSCAMRSHDVVPMPVRGPDTLKRRTLKLGQPSCGMPSRCLTMPVNGLHTLRPKAETVRRHHACQEALYLETALAISRAEPRRNNTISMLVRGPCTLRRVACPHVLMPVKRLDILRQQVPVLLTMPVRGPCTLRQSESSALVGSNACQEALYLETVSPWLSPHMITMPVNGLDTLRQLVDESLLAMPVSGLGTLRQRSPHFPYPTHLSFQCLSVGFVH